VFELRPSKVDDADPVMRLLEARDMSDFGMADFTRGELLAQWRVSGFDPSTDAVVAEDRATTVGYGALVEPGAIAFVDPEREGEGIGSALLAWLEARARQAGRRVHRQIVAQRNAHGHALLSGAGYAPVRSVLQMARSVQPPPVVPPIPDGITLQALDVSADARALHAADEAAFAETPDYEPMSLGTFSDAHLGAPGLDPALSRVMRRGDAIVGFALVQRRGADIGYIDVLAVDRAQRGRGLGRALLLTVCAACAAAGLNEVQLGVGSDNPGARRLYTRAGMTERHRIDVFEKLDAAGRARQPAKKRERRDSNPRPLP
jgi:mycothiol synthase